MRLKRKYLQEKVFSNVVNQAGPKHGMTAEHHAGLQQMITGLEKPNMLKKRLRVYFKGERTTLKFYMREYFNNFFKKIDDDSGRVVFICDSEQTRDDLYNILKEIKDDNNVDVPNPDPDPDDGVGGGDGGGGSGYYDPETGEYVEEKKSDMTTYLVIAGIVVLIAIVIIKKVL